MFDAPRKTRQSVSTPMNSPSCLARGAVLASLLALPFAPFASAQTPATPAAANAKAPALPKTDANGNALRRAPTGHVSNYDESKVGTYTLPDPLVLANGKPVRDADTWFRQRRPEIVKLYENEIYGRVPANAPKATWEIAAKDEDTLGGVAAHKRYIVHFGAGEKAVNVTVNLYLPAKATGPVPVLLHLTFFTSSVTPPAPLPGAAEKKGPRLSEAGPAADILAAGYGYAMMKYTEIQADNASGYQSGVQALAYAAGQTKPAADEWGTISAWAWGASHVFDCLATDPGVDAKRIALVGHSRLGKTVLWAGAHDPRFALVFSSCAGEMGSALARRDYGETIDDMAANFPWQFAGNFQKYSAHWNDMPVDAHMVMALIAPRPLFVTGGTGDQWADPKGEFLSEVAAGPVYRLLGKKDVGATEFPAPDTPLLTGDIGFHYHTGGHTITPSDWKAFLTFADAHLKGGM